MSAVLQIDSRAVTPPAYDNTHLGWESDWIADNALKLRDWFFACERLCDEPARPGEWQSFCGAQHDLELQRRDDYRQTLRQY